MRKNSQGGGSDKLQAFNFALFSFTCAFEGIDVDHDVDQGVVVAYGVQVSQARSLNAQLLGLRKDPLSSGSPGIAKLENP